MGGGVGSMMFWTRAINRSLARGLLTRGLHGFLGQVALGEAWRDDPLLHGPTSDATRHAGTERAVERQTPSGVVALALRYMRTRAVNGQTGQISGQPGGQTGAAEVDAVELRMALVRGAICVGRWRVVAAVQRRCSPRPPPQPPNLNLKS